MFNLNMRPSDDWSGDLLEEELKTDELAIAKAEDEVADEAEVLEVEGGEPKVVVEEKEPVDTFDERKELEDLEAKFKEAEGIGEELALMEEEAEG